MNRITAFFVIFLFFCSFAVSQPTWTDLTVSFTPFQQLNSVSSISKNVVWAAGFQGEIAYTSNGGINWSNRGGGALTGLSLYVIEALDSVTAFCGNGAGSTGFICKTTNKGQNWNILYSQPNGWIDGIKFINATTGFAYGDPVGGKWTIVKTNNGGNFWDTTGLRFNSQLNEFSYENDMAVVQPAVGGPVFIWFGTNDYNIYRSTTSGTGWLVSQVPLAAGPNIYGLAFADASTGFCASQTGLCKTTNGGVTWTLVTVPGTGLVKTIAYNFGRYWYARNNIIYFSSDNGNTFVQQHVSPSPTPYQHMSFAYSSADNIESTIGGWAITGDNVISKYNEDNIGVQQIGTEIPESFNLAQNYPNPFNPETKIRFNIPHNSGGNNIMLIIYDINGREIETLVNQNLEAGIYEADWDASKYASGIYIYKLVSGSFTETKKMILLK